MVEFLLLDIVVVEIVQDGCGNGLMQDLQTSKPTYNKSNQIDYVEQMNFGLNNLTSHPSYQKKCSNGAVEDEEQASKAFQYKGTSHKM